ncbi:hypothetical protein [Clostridium sp. HCS.1]|uniref:hypothetical protein n=1 Tax=Clostridium sp. HCS.1 TaxID=3238594 RepID=UPI003A103771
MKGFLYFAGILIIISSWICIAFIGSYAIIATPIIFALGCIVLGIGKIVTLLESKK